MKIPWDVLGGGGGPERALLSEEVVVVKLDLIQKLGVEGNIYLRVEGLFW